MSGRVPPQDLDAEESVLGAMLLSPDAIDRVESILTPGDFYRPGHGRIYAAALSLRAAGEPVDPLSVADWLDRAGTLTDVGGRARIAELAALTTATANAAHHAGIVAEMAAYRRVIAAGQRIERAAWEREGTAAEVLAVAEAELLGLTRGAAGAGPELIERDMLDGVRRLQERAASGELPGLPTGYHALDGLLHGLEPGSLIVLAGRPSMGKTALSLGIAANVALRAARPVLLFSLEMNRAEVAGLRLLAAESLVDATKVRTGRGLALEDWARINDAAARLAAAPLAVDDTAGITAAELRARARRHAARNPGLALVIVDYLQLMTSGERSDGRVQEVSQISRSLKVLARDLAVPVLALSQLSRACEMRHDKRPILSDLRESGSIEQDADIVLMIYRGEVYYPEDPDQHGVAEVIVAKQRNGPTGTAKLAWVRRHARFSDLAPGP